ncbi:MAG: acyl-CoA dehydrogenase, partial [Proteobacteria bacterium]|nr:acyl-CoA dehydrogenase [Pseudomonadota bacterium]
MEHGWKGSFEIAAIEGKLGGRSSNTAELIFQDYRFPVAQAVGERGKAFKCALNMLNGGRATVAAWATGIGQGAFEKLMKYTHEREIFGARLKDLDNTKRELAEMHTRI